jgi:hypothetical protein
MAVNLSPYGGVGAQFLDNSGNVLTGGKIFTYAAGTTTNQATYTTSVGNIPHSNPIILDASGRVPSGGEIWLTDGFAYKFILRDANDVLIATYDNVTGINSNFVAFTNQQEIQTATAGQTVFNLTTVTYQPATNSLTVFVDGVNQYGPGAQYAYLETDNDTVTFVNGLHVGAEVKFTTSQLNSSASQSDAFQVSYTPPFTSSVGTNVGDKLAQTVSVMDFGAVGDGVTDDLQAIQNAIDFCATSAGTNSVYFPAGDYYISGALNLKVAVSLIGPGRSLVATAPYARIKGAGGSQTLVQYIGTFGAEAQISLSISGLQFSDAQYAIHLLGAVNWEISDCTFSYIRGSVSHAAVRLENAIIGVIQRNKFFYCATGVRLDKGINYHNTICDNDFVVDDGFPSFTYQTFAIMVRCDAINTGFGPLNITDNNIIAAGGGGSATTNGVVVAARGNVLNICGNTFEALRGDDFVVTNIDPIDGSNRASDVAGMFVRGGVYDGNWHVDSASGSLSAYCINASYTSNMSFSGNSISPQASVTGRPVVFFGAGSNKNTWSGENLIKYPSGYSGPGIEETNSTYGTNIIIENQFIDSTADGPAWQNITSGHLRLAPKDEFAARLSQFGTADQGVEWMSSVSKRKMLVLSDGSAAIQARQAIETAPVFTDPTSTVTLNGTERTLRFFQGGTVNTISGALYDGQILSVFNSSSISVTITQTGNIRVNGGTTLVLAQDEGATFVWWGGGNIWAQI